MQGALAAHHESCFQEAHLSCLAFVTSASKNLCHVHATYGFVHPSPAADSVLQVGKSAVVEVVAGVHLAGAVVAAEFVPAAPVVAADDAAAVNAAPLIAVAVVFDVASLSVQSGGAAVQALALQA
mmetsp:Transcript_66328/g.117286  ORF Transcript_66328/g.117286 Transcript_66328/m.117286 type:complete len:125 (-) Transcript_66328:499-873(-)